jgi:hypothetical protein
MCNRSHPLPLPILRWRKNIHIPIGGPPSLNIIFLFVSNLFHLEAWEHYISLIPFWKPKNIMFNLFGSTRWLLSIRKTGSLGRN